MDYFKELDEILKERRFYKIFQNERGNYQVYCMQIFKTHKKESVYEKEFVTRELAELALQGFLNKQPYKVKIGQQYEKK